MKIKGVKGDLKIKKNFLDLKSDNSKNISKTFSGTVADSSFSDSSLGQLVLLKVYRPLPM